MSDYGKTPLPVDLWREIARYLTDDELKTLQQISRFFHHDVMYTSAFLQPKYNRFHALDESLPVLLPQNNFQVTLIYRRFGACFSKIASRQAEEIAYLKLHHPAFFTEQVNAILDQESLTLEVLEQKSTVLDAINSYIVEQEIIKTIETAHLKNTTLNIRNKNITRLPQSLMLNEKYQEFWANLKKLHCDGNRALYALNVQTLVSLKELHCTSCRLEILNIRGLKNLIELRCGNNKLSSLDFQGVVNLVFLDCNVNNLTFLNIQNLHELALLTCVNNPLTHLDLQGKTKLKVVLIQSCPLQDLNLIGTCLDELSSQSKMELLETEEHLLFKQLLNCDISSSQQKAELISRLGKRYTFANCEKQLGTTAALSIFACEGINYAKTCFFSLPIFNFNKPKQENTESLSQKRSREEDKSEDNNVEPPHKKHKKNPPKG